MKRFWEKVEKSDGCWEWTANKSEAGYGIFWFEGKKSRAHRVAWELVNGPIFGGLQVCHICDNPSCVKLEHLFLGTNQDNVTDRNMKGRQAKGEKTVEQS